MNSVHSMKRIVSILLALLMLFTAMPAALAEGGEAPAQETVQQEKKEEKKEEPKPAEPKEERKEEKQEEPKEEPKQEPKAEEKPAEEKQEEQKEEPADPQPEEKPAEEPVTPAVDPAEAPAEEQEQGGEEAPADPEATQTSEATDTPEAEKKPEEQKPEEEKHEEVIEGEVHASIFVDGFEFVFDPRYGDCQHDGGYKLVEERSESTYKDKSGDLHTATYTLQTQKIICNLCGQESKTNKVNKEVSTDEAHVYVDDICKYCEHVRETGCQHTNTKTLSGEKVENISSLNDEQHLKSGYTYADYVIIDGARHSCTFYKCNDCGAIGYVVEDSIDPDKAERWDLDREDITQTDAYSDKEDHNYVDNVCTVCKHEIKCKHDYGESKKAVKTTQTYEKTESYHRVITTTDYTETCKLCGYIHEFSETTKGEAKAHSVDSWIKDSLETNFKSLSKSKHQITAVLKYHGICSVCGMRLDRSAEKSESGNHQYNNCECLSCGETMDIGGGGGGTGGGGGGGGGGFISGGGVPSNSLGGFGGEGSEGESVVKDSSYWLNFTGKLTDPETKEKVDWDVPTIQLTYLGCEVYPEMLRLYEEEGQGIVYEMSIQNGIDLERSRKAEDTEIGNGAVSGSDYWPEGSVRVSDMMKGLKSLYKLYSTDLTYSPIGIYWWAPTKDEEGNIIEWHEHSAVICSLDDEEQNLYTILEPADSLKIYTVQLLEDEMGTIHFGELSEKYAGEDTIVTLLTRYHLIVPIPEEEPEEEQVDEAAAELQQELEDEFENLPTGEQPMELPEEVTDEAET